MEFSTGMGITAGLWIIVTIGVWITAKIVSKSIYCGADPKAEDYAEKVSQIDKTFSIAGKILAALWIIGLLILFGLGGTYQREKGADMGATQTAIEAEQYVPPVVEEIKTGNVEALERDDVTREKEVAEERKKSRDEFNDFLNAVGP